MPTDAYLTSRYGLSREDMEGIIRAQLGHCAICKRVPKKWCVDHCHRTGRVRGILCPSCNTGMGLLGDSAKSVYRAVKYLRRRTYHFRARTSRQPLRVGT